MSRGEMSGTRCPAQQPLSQSLSESEALTNREAPAGGDFNALHCVGGRDTQLPQAMKHARRAKGLEKVTIDQLADEWRKG